MRSPPLCQRGAPARDVSAYLLTTAGETIPAEEILSQLPLPSRLRLEVVRWEDLSPGPALIIVPADPTLAAGLLHEEPLREVFLLEADPEHPDFATALAAGARYCALPPSDPAFPAVFGSLLHGSQERLSVLLGAREEVQTLHRRCNLFQHAMASASVGIWEWDAISNEIHLEPNLKAMLGYADLEIRNHLSDWMRHVHPADYRCVMEAHLACAEGASEGFELEYRMRHRDGSMRWFFSRGQACPGGPAGRHVFGAATDITPLKEAQSALLETEKRYRAIVDIQSEMICRTRRTGRITFVNRAFARFWRVRPEELAGRNLLDLLPTDRQEEARLYLCSFTPERPRQSHLTEVSRPGGGSRWILWSGSAIYDEIGNLLEIQSVGRDITDQELAREAIRRSEARLRQVIDLVPHMVFAKDRHGRYLFVNKATADAYNLTVEEVEGRHQSDLHPGDESLEGHFAADREVIDSGRGKFIPEEEFIDHSGQRRILQTTKIPFHLHDSETDGVLGVAVDITHRRQIEEALRMERGRFCRLLELLPAFVLLVSEDGIVQFANHRFIELHGDPRGRPCAAVLLAPGTPPSECRILQVLEEGESRTSRMEDSAGRPWLVHDIHFRDGDGRAMVLEVGLDLTEKGTAPSVPPIPTPGEHI